jgi:hypothetical protein
LLSSYLAPTTPVHEGYLGRLYLIHRAKTKREVGKGDGIAEREESQLGPYKTTAKSTGLFQFMYSLCGRQEYRSLQRDLHTLLCYVRGITF